MLIAIDFDGTCVTHEYPNIGAEIGAPPVLRDLVANGHRLMLWTMRSGEQLGDALGWFRSHGIELWGVNENPEQHTWTDSKKLYANLYIDDAALGCPLISTEGHRPFVDWLKVVEMLEDNGYL